MRWCALFTLANDVWPHKCVQRAVYTTYYYCAVSHVVVVLLNLQLLVVAWLISVHP
jgi:hypothetical protein